MLETQTNAISVALCLVHVVCPQKLFLLHCLGLSDKLVCNLAFAGGNQLCS
jgi:hypothetical protein